MAIPVDPRVLQNLQLAKRACNDLGKSGELIELWEGYVLAQADGAGLTKELDKMASLRGVGTMGAAFQRKLADLRKDTVPLVEYLRQTLPMNVPLLADRGALDLALVFIMSTPPARDAVVRWFKNPSGSRDETMKLLKTMSRMVESYQAAVKEPEEAPPPPVKPPPAADDVDRLLQERIEAQRKARDRSITERRTKDQDDAAKAVRAREAAVQAEIAETQARRARLEAESKKDTPDPIDPERAAREKSEAERIAKLEADAAKASAMLEEARQRRLKAEAETAEREKAEVERVAR